MSLPNGPVDESLASGNSQEALDRRITRLIESQPFAVLCTQGQGQPYGSLVAYAVTEDLAAGIVERRGGMLIHGAIIAGEMQIPCVNGIANAVDLLEDGQIVTVDGHLGIVTVGPPEFELELR